MNRIFRAAEYAIAFTLGLSLCAAELLPPGAKVPTSSSDKIAEQARGLLRSGKVDQADRLIQNAREISPGDARLLCVWGDILFRRADFANAARAYQSALELNPDSASSYLGLARIAQVEFRRKSARDLFSKASRLNQDDPEIGSFYQTGLHTPAYSKLSSAYTRYELKLTGFHPTSSSPSGTLVTAVINGGKPLRLVFDTGFSGMLINGKAARSLVLEAISGVRLIGGLGDSRPHPVAAALARTVAFGGLEFRDCLIQVDPGVVTPGADGVLGADAFSQFEIHLDARSRRLTLIPLADEGKAWEETTQAAGPVYAMNHLLLVKAKLNRQREGLFLLDTAAAFTSISEEIARPWEHRSTVPLMGARGLLSHVFRVPPVELDFGGHPIIDRAPVAMDLKQMSQQIGVEISGVLGYSLLSSSTLTINYRDGIVQLANDSPR